MADRWILERTLGAPSGNGAFGASAHWIAPDASRACVITNNGWLVETDLRSFNERIVRVFEIDSRDVIVRTAFLTGTSPVLVFSTSVWRGGSFHTDLYLCNLDESATPRRLVAGLFEPDQSNALMITKQSLDGALFAVVHDNACVLFERDGTPFRDLAIEAAFRSDLAVVLSRSTVAQLRDGDVVVSSLAGSHEDRISCGLSSSKERRSLIAAGPSSLAIRRKKNGAHHAVVVDLESHRISTQSQVRIERGWHEGGCVADDRSLVVAGVTVRIYERGQSPRAAIAFHSAFVAALTADSLIMHADQRWSVVPRATGSWAQRTTGDNSSFTDVHVGDDGAVFARDSDSTLFFWPPTRQCPSVTARAERASFSSTDSWVGLAEGSSLLVVLRENFTTTRTGTIVAYAVSDDAISERWTMDFAPVFGCWFDNEARVFLGTDQSDCSLVHRADRSSNAGPVAIAAGGGVSRNFTDERTFETFDSQAWARFELVEGRFVERERVARQDLPARQLCAPRSEAPADAGSEVYVTVYTTPRGLRLNSAANFSRAQLSRDQSCVLFALTRGRSLVTCTPDGDEFTQWIAVDPNDPLDAMSAISFSPDARRIAVGTIRGTIRVFLRAAVEEF